MSADRGAPRGAWSSTGVVGAVADERSGVPEAETVGDGAAEDAAVLFPLRKKFTLNPGTTMIAKCRTKSCPPLAVLSLLLLLRRCQVQGAVTPTFEWGGVGGRIRRRFQFVEDCRVCSCRHFSGIRQF